MTYYNFMIDNYLDQDNEFGDLAEDIQKDKENFPMSDDRSEILSYLQMHHAFPGCIRAFKETWRHYKKAKRKAETDYILHGGTDPEEDSAKS